ncbi:signal recognition particle-docking protein FtsY [Haliangium sp.]|uniref:signal recognition particle-docking protein FtsY n=1 Tax=Haliangium sp. TaxID=2663208 RepID=UPI003D0B76A5
MTGTEIAYLIGALAAVFLFLFLVRRASEKQTGVRDRLEQRDDDRDTEDNRRELARRAPSDADDSVDDSADAAEDNSAADAADQDDGEPAADDADEREPAAQDQAVPLSAGLAKTRGGFVARLGKLFARKKIDADVLDELEQVLFTADIGPKTAERLFQSIKGRLSKDELEDPEAIWTELRRQSTDILAVDAPAMDFTGHTPFVLLVIGVNGVGKTTTIGKIAAKLSAEGKRVLLGAGDTFRAAAVEQLQIWGERAGAPVVTGKSGGDPSSVIFDAIKRGVDEGFDVVICDTAGRLHTKIDLMDELKKVGRVCDKALPGCPHETWLVLDATTGQNAIQQAQMFKEAMDITGIVLTKLDGTAKGGVILGICDELAVPVRYIGIGEGVSDLRAFEVAEFVDALYQHADGA